MSVHGSIFRRIAGLGATVAVGWWLKENYDARKAGWQAKFIAHESELQYKYMQTGWAHYSGTSTKMDHVSHAIQNFGILGILGNNSLWNLSEMYHLWKIRTEGLMNDVILPNLVPIAIGIGGLYVGLGEKLFKAPFQGIGYFFRQSKPIRTLLWNTMKTPFQNKQFAQRFMAGTQWTLKKLIHGGTGTLLAGGIGALLLYQFMRVHNHVAQHEFFRHFTGLNQGDH